MGSGLVGKPALCATCMAIMSAVELMQVTVEEESQIELFQVRTRSKEECHNLCLAHIHACMLEEVLEYWIVSCGQCGKWNPDEMDDGPQRELGYCAC